MLSKLKRQNLLKNLFRYLALFSGFFILANGIVFTIQANLGVNPWDVLHIGLSNQTGLSLGRVMQGLGLILIVVSYFFKIRIYTGTILNMIFLGLFVDMVIGLDYVPVPDSLWLKVLLYATGVAIFGFGCAVYMSANLGAGPRDSMMLALAKVFPYRLGMIRTAMEVTVTLLGFLLGGPLGIGTIIFAVSVGNFMDLGFAIIRQFKKTVFYKSHLVDPIRENAAKQT